MTEQEFYNQLLKKTEETFLKSDICKYQKEKTYEWNYSICGTPILKNTGILLGLNWGVGQDLNFKFPVPFNMSKEDNINEYTFISHSRGYLESVMGLNFEQVNFNYSNLCFFRSHGISDLTEKDWDLSFMLFDEFVEYIQPPWMLLMGVEGIRILEKHTKITGLEYLKITDNYYSAIAYYNSKTPLICIQHPTSQTPGLDGQTRQQLLEMAKIKLNL